jgi:protein SCO1
MRPSQSVEQLYHWSRRHVVGGLSAGMLLAGCSREIAPASAAIDLTGADYGKDFRLQDTSGRWRTLADYRGKVVLLFFGFTQCPDVCPSAMMQAVEVLKQLGDDGTKVQVLFVSLDPERDTPEVLRAFVASFHPSFVALRGDVDLTRKTADDFKVFYRKVPLAGSYTIDHSAMVYLYDARGRLRRALRPGQPAQAQVAAIKALMDTTTTTPA